MASSTSPLDQTLPTDLLQVKDGWLLVERSCSACGAQTLLLLFELGTRRRRTVRTLAGCPWHRFAPHCLFDCDLLNRHVERVVGLWDTIAPPRA